MIYYRIESAHRCLALHRCSLHCAMIYYRIESSIELDKTSVEEGSRCDDLL